MGSDSDLPIMNEAKEILDSFGVANEITIVSAHRTTRRMVQYATSAKKRGVEVIIAGAGGSAHLPGMVASLTAVPVIGVPIKTKTLEGLDSLLSIAQMPPGVPVAAMAINGAKNAGLLACEILGTKYSHIRTKIEEYKFELEQNVLQKARKLEKSGVERYLRGL
jgi:5-(carboxyamino)imidazole ribonucleotide mutase